MNQRQDDVHDADCALWSTEVIHSPPKDKATYPLSVDPRKDQHDDQDHAA